MVLKNGYWYIININIVQSENNIAIQVYDLIIYSNMQGTRKIFGHYRNSLICFLSSLRCSLRNYALQNMIEFAFPKGMLFLKCLIDQEQFIEATKVTVQNKRTFPVTMLRCCGLGSSCSLPGAA